MAATQLTREEMEALALENMCPCFYYDAVNQIEFHTDAELEAIIADEMACHYINQKYDPQSEADFQEELRECPCYVERAAWSWLKDAA